MIFNKTHRFLQFFDQIDQEAIYRCPGYFAMSAEEVLKSAHTPAWLATVVRMFPFTGKRPTLFQIRPQDFRVGRPAVLGDGWHIDSNVRLADGVERNASSLTDWQLYTVSFGNVAPTEFMAAGVEIDEARAADPSTHGELFGQLNASYLGEVHAPANGQLASYTSCDIHRAGTLGPAFKPGLRLVVIAFESSDIPAGGIVLPSLADLAEGRGNAKIEDFTK